LHQDHLVRPRQARLAFLTLASFGIVFGDIGTSPLYALRECFAGTHAIPVTQDNVLGVLSLIFWSLIITVSLKYLVFVLRADNGGEGGILALVALVRARPSKRTTHALISIGLFGAALLYGDGMITPAISVLSAVEGVNVATRAFEPYVVPATVVILVALFMFQRSGTSGIGKVFGPVMIAWFATIAVAGALAIRDAPAVAASLNPLHAVRFFAAHGWRAFLTLGAVFLALTGAEALYADLGHFGRTPIRLAWFAVVLPSLVLNYLGQGAVLLTNPGARLNPFYALLPGRGLYPMVLLATVATVIASQAIISGAFSLTYQAMQLGYSPRFDVQHTSSHEYGQVYIPAINWMLMVATVGLVLAFKTSTNLAAAYGMAVTTTMVITTILAYAVTRTQWGWGLAPAALVTTVFLAVDLMFFGANLIKIAHGGWVPLLVAAGIYTVMSTWHTGRELVARMLARAGQPLDAFLHEITTRPPARVPGTGIFMTARAEDVPPILVHHLKHNKVLHEHVVLLTVAVRDVPSVDAESAVEVRPLDCGLYRVVVNYGFTQQPDVPAALKTAESHGLSIDSDTTYYLANLTLFANARIGMSRWRDNLFILLSRNARRATNFFRIPPDCVVEIGIQLEL
jgi:KUP system potassium uptake protein